MASPLVLRSVYRPQHEKGGIRAQTEISGTGGHEQPIKVGHEKRGARAGGCLEQGSPAISRPSCCQASTFPSPQLT